MKDIFLFLENVLIIVTGLITVYIRVTNKHKIGKILSYSYIQISIESIITKSKQLFGE